ncbi:hypothetical protein EXW48_08375 [Bacillus wiedmannii]|nr:hypothetical protein EXW48_08375 [Bacillus wiedmannii]
MKNTPFSLHNEKLTYLFQYSQLISTKRAILFELLFLKRLSIRYMKLYRRLFKYIDDSLHYINDFSNISTIRQVISTYRQITTNSLRIISCLITLFSKL